MITFIGSKIINAEPQEKDGQPGYKVIYPDGYESWSPKAVFEEAYRPVNEGERDMMLVETDSNLYRYAQEELSRVDLEYDGMISQAVLQLVGMFGAQGHSGGSASITMTIAARLMRFQPLTPLTGEDDEWMEVTTGVFQSTRCPSVFKENGVAYDIDVEGRPPITFPYEPGVKK